MTKPKIVMTKVRNEKPGAKRVKTRSYRLLDFTFDLVNGDGG